MKFYAPYIKENLRKKDLCGYKHELVKYKKNKTLKKKTTLREPGADQLLLSRNLVLI